MSIFPALGLGFLLGLQHAADPDHLAAVATMITRAKRLGEASRLGVWWGLGHTTTLWLVGLAVLIFQLAISPRLALSFELLVGIMLIALGANLWRQIIAGKLHAHKHQHADSTHTHLHRHERSPAHSHRHLSFATGLLHGLAGSAALVVLTLATAPTFWQGLLFIAVFGLGSILGMLAASTALTMPLLLWRRHCRALPITMAVAGILSVGMGMAAAASAMTNLLNL